MDSASRSILDSLYEFVPTAPASTEFQRVLDILEGDF